ncbi:NnrU family protein [Frigidibacter mobilis]|uniref:NnrU family protein n=1 Tax=Frigidibacter mobilis TaxID=1335048 RepID=A0A159Z5Z4_9RHOB|nr:NnrU family protein [Frigidibacter mobilis]AMY70711.1 NnrU family protein [Frigidibacter mobilis]
MGRIRGSAGGVRGIARAALAARARGWLVARMGRRLYSAAFGIASTLLLVWLIVAAGRAPLVLLWDQAPWMRWVPNLVMPVVCVLAALAIGAPNPFSFEGRARGFDPARPGIAGLMRHPLLWVLLAWALAHLLVNGDLAHGVLFGGFAAMALAGIGLQDARHRRVWGAADWARLSAQTSALPLAALLAGRWRPGLPGRGTLLRVGAGLLVWAALWQLHLPVIGASPMP